MPRPMDARRATDYGIRDVGTVSVDMKAVKARKDAIVEASRNSLSDWLAVSRT